ncbi:MAG: DUF2085 domain-containing protein [Pyrinomonadaceae bacterium]
MPELAKKYVPIDVRSELRAQAVKVWAITCVFVLVWLLQTVLPPFLIENGASKAAAAIYGFFSYVCHQIPERSFQVLNHQFAVCSRCFGVYFGLFAGILTYPLWRPVDSVEPLPRMWLFLSLVPIAIDWSLGVFGIWENNHFSRFVTGLILGIACAVYIVPALVEIVRNLSHRRFRTFVD